MAQLGPVTALSSREVGFVEWSAILAGAVIAVAISFVLFTFGTAIGLSAASPWPNSGLSAKLIASLAVFWVMAQQIGAFMAGGYVAGRMRPRWTEAQQHEVEFRDGLHGGLVWAVGIVIGAVLLLATAGMATSSGVRLAGAAAGSTNALDAVVDTMTRPAAIAPAGPGRPATPSASTSSSEDYRAELRRIVTGSVASGTQLSSQDRTYAAQVIAARTGLTPQDAEQRIDQAVASARQIADKARRGAILTGFVTAASLLISFAAAWWAALKGGQHRDDAVPAQFPFAERRPALTSR